MRNKIICRLEAMRKMRAWWYNRWLERKPTHSVTNLVFNWNDTIRSECVTSVRVHCGSMWCITSRSQPTNRLSFERCGTFFRRIWKIIINNLFGIIYDCIDIFNLYLIDRHTRGKQLCAITMALAALARTFVTQSNSNLLVLFWFWIYSVVILLEER